MTKAFLVSCSQSSLHSSPPQEMTVFLVEVHTQSPARSISRLSSRISIKSQLQLRRPMRSRSRNPRRRRCCQARRSRRRQGCAHAGPVRRRAVHVRVVVVFCRCVGGGELGMFFGEGADGFAACFLKDRVSERNGRKSERGNIPRWCQHLGTAHCHLHCSCAHWWPGS